MNTPSMPRFLSAAVGLLAAWLPYTAYAGCDDFSGICVFDVTSTLDRIDRVPGDGVCDSPPNVIGGSPGPCTLRAAIMEANARDQASSAAGPYTIHLPAGDYPLTRSGPLIPDDDDANGSLNIFADDVTIAGPGDGAYAVIRGSGAFAGRLLHVKRAHNLAIRDVELTAAEHGISCLNDDTSDLGSMKLTRVRLHHLIALPSDNGAIPDGGAIESTGDCHVEITDSELWANENGGRGSAILIGAHGRLTAARTALIGNGGANVPANTEGSALFTASAHVFLHNVTVAGNRTGRFGAVAVTGQTNPLLGPFILEMSSVTIARNVTSESDGTAGLYLTRGEGSFQNTVIADNVGGSGDLRFESDSDLFSGGHNVFGSIAPESGNYSFLPQLTDRMDRTNVGFVQVPTSLPASIGTTGLRPLPGGLLIDQANPLPYDDSGAGGACQVRDTSGRKRRAGGRCDIGAMEYFPEPWTFHAVQLADATDGDPGDGVCSTVVLPGAPNAATCTLRAAVMESAQLHDDGHVSVFTAKLAPGNHRLSIGDNGDSDPASGDLDVYGFEFAVRGDASLVQAASTVLADTGFSDRLFNVENGARLNLTDVALADANIQLNGEYGAGVYCDDSVLTVNSSRFHDLRALGGAAMFVSECNASISDSDIVDNEGSTEGGAMSSNNSVVTIARSTLRNNRGGSGSAIGVLGFSTDLTMTAVTVSGNHGVADNAAVVVYGKGWLRNVTITDNTADAGATDRGALWVVASSDNLTLTNSIVSGNTGGSDINIAPLAVVIESFNLIGTLTPGSDSLPQSLPGQPSGVGTLTQLSDTGLSWGHIPIPVGVAHNTANPGPGFSDDPDSPLCARYDHSYRDRGMDPDHLCDIGAVEYFAVPPPPVPLDTIFRDGFELF